MATQRTGAQGTATGVTAMLAAGQKLAGKIGSALSGAVPATIVPGKKTMCVPSVRTQQSSGLKQCSGGISARREQTSAAGDY